MDAKLEAYWKRERRSLKEEIGFLRSMLYDATHGIETDFPDPIPNEREGEPVNKTILDGFVKELLGW